MQRNTNVYAVESDKSVATFVQDFAAIARSKNFVINNAATMDMKKTFTEHGGNVPEDFDLHMIQICKPTKADKSLTANPERAILMPKFVHVFTKNSTTQIRYLSYEQEDIEALVPEDPKFPESLAGTHSTIHSMIDEAR
ncbi:DUF302 domain-containing protein [Desulfogranum japonicum]|uniref:DUF302 domain-containing protein n=1 Tax=Desulfogranum japonicum TaxID=231447 RepID=UPI000422F48B|nr:DUF302 domain-containing protein [Desulfogranum japonicum]